MRVDVLAVGTELLLGQITDTNSAWIGETLAASGLDTYDHRKVGDNLDRITATVRAMVDAADALVICGGLGPTQDDVTREAIARALGVDLERRPELVEQLEARFAAMRREMAAANLRQADLPIGATAIPNPIGTAPGVRAELVASDGRVKVVYAVPGVPVEMRRMMAEQVVPDLLERSGERAVIVSRSLKCWGTSESALSELIADRVDGQTNPTIAFLARGIEGLYVRLTAKATDVGTACAVLDEEEAQLRPLLGELVFGVDDETMESVVLAACRERGWSLGVAESATGGLVAGRLAGVPGCGDTFLGAVVSYDTGVKRSVLGVTAEHVVSEECAVQMADGVRRVLGCDVGLAITGVAGPDTQEGQPVGTLWFGLAIAGRPTEAVSTRMPGERDQIRQYATISLLNLARLRLASLPASPW